MGLFGSYAKDKQTKFSDIDIVYKLDYEKFSQKYIGGFAKLIKINNIKNELEENFKVRIDLVANSNEKIFKDIIYV